MKYLVTTYEEEVHRYYYRVETDSEEEAKEKVMSGDLDYESSKLVSAEVVSVDVEEIGCAEL